MELFIVRHGHSPFHATTDHQRCLSELGSQQANLSAHYIYDKLKNKTRLIVSSDAQRTLSTASIIQNKLMDCQLFSDEKFYTARIGEWCDAIVTNQQVDNLILVGHNPTMSLLAQHLLPQQSFHFQPACVAHFNLEIAQDGLKLPALLKGFYIPDAKKQ